MTFDHKFSLCSREKFQQSIQMQLSKKQKKLFLNFLLEFKNLHPLLNILTKNMTLIADVFSKLRMVKDKVR